MSYWNGKDVISIPDKDCGNGWVDVDCYCCNGLQWGGDSPVECTSCKGNGHYFRHKKSGALALYPGGQFIGKELKEGLDELEELADGKPEKVRYSKQIK